MRKSIEVPVLAALCLLSLVVGWIVGRGVQEVGVALFFYLLATVFFLAMFRPHSSL